MLIWYRIPKGSFTGVQAFEIWVLTGIRGGVRAFTGIGGGGGGFRAFTGIRGVWASQETMPFMSLIMQISFATTMAHLRALPFIPSLPRAAEVQWAIMNPEFMPPSSTRKAGRSLYAGFNSLSCLLSLMLASSCTPMAR
jgi:hypothetical protein